jgi:hypothetical protein
MLAAVAALVARGAPRAGCAVAAPLHRLVVNFAPRAGFATLGGGPDEGGEPDGDGEAPSGAVGTGRGAGGGMRRGRPFLDPRAPRRQEAIRSDPKHAAWGGMIDILEHNAYQDAQREEDADGWFFDGTKAEYDRCGSGRLAGWRGLRGCGDATRPTTPPPPLPIARCSDAEGDPFANGYLTEDEMEFTPEYAPATYTPARVADQVAYLHTVRGYTVQRLAAKFGVTSERVSAMLLLKRLEPRMRATGRHSLKIDAAMQDLYGDRFAKTAAIPSDGDASGPGPFDQGVDVTMLKDDQVSAPASLGGGPFKRLHPPPPPICRARRCPMTCCPSAARRATCIAWPSPCPR